MKKSTSNAIIAIMVFSMFGLGMQAQNASAATLATDPAPTSISAQVNETITLTSCNNVTIPAITPAAGGASQNNTQPCTITTNTEGGIRVSVIKVAGTATQTLRHSDNTTYITDTGAGLTAFDGTAGTTAAWTAATTRGLGFRVTETSTLSNDNTIWGTDAAPEYAALPVSSQIIYSKNGYLGTPYTMNVNYRLDVPTTQKAGTYGAQVQYSATTSP